MTRWITIRNPSTGGTAKIAETALGIFTAAGWELAPPAPPPAPAPAGGGDHTDGTPQAAGSNETGE